MRRSFFHAVIASILISTFISPNGVGQAYLPREQNRNLTIQLNHPFLAQANEDEKAIFDEVISSFLKVVWAFFLILCVGLLSRNLWIFLFGKGSSTVILPFNDFLKESDLKDQKDPPEGNDEKTSKIGEAIVDRLIMELHDIRQKYEDIEIRDQSIIARSRKLQPPLGEACVDASSLRKQILVGSPIFPGLRVGDANVVRNIGEVTTSVPVGTKISLDRLIVLIRRIWPFNQKNRVISGSIQKYKNGIQIIARLEEGTHTRAWQSSPDADNPELAGAVHKLAFLIAKDLSRQNLSESGFKALLSLLEDYSKFIHGDPNIELIKICENSLKFIEQEPTYEGIFGLLYNIGISALEEGGNELTKKAEKVFRHAISLEPFIVDKVFDTKVSYKDLNWGKDFWKNAFKEYRAKTGWQNYFAYNLRALRRRSSLNPDLRNEYKRISMWANGLSYTLIALGETLEKLDSSKDSQTNHFIQLNQAEEAYYRADQRDRRDASALVHLGSLKIENVCIFESHKQRREGIAEEAYRILKKALDKSENKFLAFNRLGNLFHDQGDYKQAIEFYQEACQDCPEFVVAYRNLGIAYGEVLEFEKAINSFNQGMSALPDDAIFQVNYCSNKWHAWLHNGIGWTYLLKSLHTTGKCNGHDLLNQAKYNFHEAIKISGGDMFASKLNLGNTYALDGDQDNACRYWQEGISDLKSKYKDSVLAQLLDMAYDFSDSQVANKLSPERLKLFVQEKNPPIRITNAVLLDLLIIKKHQSLQGKHTKKLDKAIEIIEDYLPTLYIAVSYIWKRQQGKAVSIFYRKLPELYYEFKQSPYSFSFFSSYLWLMIYSGLIKIFNDPKNISDQFNCKQFDTSFQLDEAISRFNEEAQKNGLQELQINSLISYSLEELSQRINEALERFERRAKQKDENREFFRQVLNDMHRKYGILSRGVGVLCKGNYQIKIDLIFRPIEIFYQELKARIARDKRIDDSKYYLSCYQLKDYLIPNSSFDRFGGSSTCYSPSALIHSLRSAQKGIDRQE